jgi:hypothetical protein
MSIDHLQAAATPDTRAPARDRLLGLSGLGFVGVLVLVLAVPHTGIDNAYDKPPSSSYITHFFHQHYGLEQYQALMHSIAGVLLLVFGVALAAQVKRTVPQSGADRLVTAGATGISAIMLITMMLVAGTITLTGGVDGQTQWWLYNLGWEEHFKALYLWPVMLVPACTVLGRVRALPQAVTWGGQLVVVLCVVAMVGGLSSGTDFLQFPVFFLTMVWVLATSIVVLTRGVGAKR